MKKILLSVALVCAAMCMNAEVVSKDTVEYVGAFRLDKVEKVNDYGEISVRYVCYLLDFVNTKGEPRKVTTDRATYESGEVTHIVYNIQDSGAKRIAKAVNVNAQKKGK
jgi:hypothetical protein